MKVLLVDDTRTNRLIISKYLRDMGHEVVEAGDGEEGVNAYRDCNPDLVLMDVKMPNVDGHEAARQIRDLEAGDSWTPVIFLSANSADDDVAAGIEAGGDDYLQKPVSKIVLGAKMKAMSRIAEMRHTIHTYASAQEQINQREAEERELARYVFDRMTRSHSLHHPWIDFISWPSSHFSGDIIAAETTPSGDMHLLLGDATGHGLAAGLTVMPVADLFYALTARNEPIETIALKLNMRLHDLLPTGRFVAAVLVSVRPDIGQVEVWNGGCPPVYCVDSSGGIKNKFSSRHLPLGVLPEIAEIAVETLEYDPINPEKLYLFSDGVPDAENRDNAEQFSLEHVEQSLASTSKNRLGDLATALEKHIGARSAQDDISIVEVSPPVVEEGQTPLPFDHQSSTQMA